MLKAGLRGGGATDKPDEIQGLGDILRGNTAVGGEVDDFPGGFFSDGTIAIVIAK